MRIAKIINLKQSLKYLYHNFVPETVKVSLSTYLDSLPKHRLRASNAIRTENYYQACIKELKNKKKDGVKNNQYLHEAFKKHLVRSNLVDEQWWVDYIKLLKLPKGSKFHNSNQSLINLNFQSATCSSGFSMYLTEAFFLGSICTESTVPLVFSIFNLDVYLD